MFFYCNAATCNSLRAIRLSEKVPSRLSFSKRAFLRVFFRDLFADMLKYLYLCIVERKDRRAGH